MASVCPFAASGQRTSDAATGGGSAAAAAVPRCPLGYDSGNFKLGPLSCVICRALLFNAARCLPCRHVFCRACISRFSDCPLCGVDITGLEADAELQGVVDKFIQGHARMSRKEDQAGEVAYEQSGLTRGTFLLQHAMRAFQAQNLENCKARLELCLEDTWEMISASGGQPEAKLTSQLGAILGLLGDCLRSSGDVEGAISNYSESVRALEQLNLEDMEVVHALSVSLNKLGDMKYYADDLESARDLYKRALRVRQDCCRDSGTLSSENIDIAVSLAKVADVERAMGLESEAMRGFGEAVSKLNSLAAGRDAAALDKRRESVLGFLHAQMSSSNR